MPSPSDWGTARMGPSSPSQRTGISALPGIDWIGPWMPLGWLILWPTGWEATLPSDHYKNPFILLRVCSLLLVNRVSSADHAGAQHAPERHFPLLLAARSR